MAYSSSPYLTYSSTKDDESDAPFSKAQRKYIDHAIYRAMERFTHVLLGLTQPPAQATIAEAFANLAQSLASPGNSTHSGLKTSSEVLSRSHNSHGVSSTDTPEHIDTTHEGDVTDNSPDTSKKPEASAQSASSAVAPTTLSSAAGALTHATNDIAQVFGPEVYVHPGVDKRLLKDLKLAISSTSSTI